MNLKLNMTLKDATYKELIENVCHLVSAEYHLPSALKAANGLLIILCMLFIERLPKI